VRLPERAVERSVPVAAAMPAPFPISFPHVIGKAFRLCSWFGLQPADQIS
jgi:hypothetical protein